MRTDHWHNEAAFFDADAESKLLALRPIDPLAIARYSSPRLRRRFGREFRFKTVDRLEGKTVLDVGCGDGTDTVLLARLGAARVVGVDLSPKAIELGRRRAEINGLSERVSFVCAAVETAELPESGFDIVWCNAILHHLTDNLELVMRRLVSWAKPGGLLSFAEPINFSPTLRRVRRSIPIRRCEVTPDERPLEPRDFRILERFVGDMQVRHFGLLGRIDQFVLTRMNYERSSWVRRAIVNLTGACDWALLSLRALQSFGSTSVIWGRPIKDPASSPLP